MVSGATAEVLDPQRMTLEAWAQMDEDAPGELVDGRLVEDEVARNLLQLVAPVAKHRAPARKAARQ